MMVHQSVGGTGGWGWGVVISVVVVRRCALIPQAEACDSLLGGGSVKCIKRVVKAQTSVICVGCISAASLRGAPCRVIIRLDYCQSCTAEDSLRRLHKSLQSLSLMETNCGAALCQRPRQGTRK